MKKIIVLPVMAMMAIAAIPNQSQALSCLDQESMLTHIVSDPDYLVVTAVPTANKEFVKEKATEAHLHDSGYTGQFLKIKEAHKGSVSEEQWVYFTKDSTWEYLCAGKPPALNTERIYVITTSTHIFEPATVVTTFEVGSLLADDLLAELEEAEDQGEPTVYETTAADWRQRLHDELRDMAFILKLKLAEWNFWKDR